MAAVEAERGARAAMRMQPKRELAADSLQIAQWTKIDAIVGCG
jgi:hypothetical protein